MQESLLQGAGRQVASYTASERLHFLVPEK